MSLQKCEFDDNDWKYNERHKNYQQFKNVFEIKFFNDFFYDFNE